MLVTELELQIASFLVTICDWALTCCVLSSQPIKGNTGIDWDYMKEKKTIKGFK